MGRKSVKIEKKLCQGKCKDKNIMKPLDEFWHSRSFMHPDGRTSICKECSSAYLKDINDILVFLAHTNLPFLTKVWFEDAKEDIGKYIQRMQQKQNQNKTFKDSDKEVTVTPVFSSTNEKSEKTYSGKWMGEYTETEIKYMEDYYDGLAKDFKIITTNHKDYAKKICKASLHMDKCFEEVLSNVSGAEAKYKAARETFDTLSKSAQFSESGRKQNDIGNGNFSKIVEKVEASTYIPKYEPVEEDLYDKLLKNMKHVLTSV